MRRTCLVLSVVALAAICQGSFGPLTPSAKPYEREYIWPDGKMPDVQAHQIEIGRAHV